MCNHYRDDEEEQLDRLQAAWQRCYVHFLRNALEHLPRKAADDCLTE